ncbi:helix-turn-helix domain-containing protein [Salinibacterium sp. PAMC 21357]|uniref:helix-turn-helix domain-containing protein n=1 Tax=Salinibacterium sp. PAMC 21357 TaxID=1112215 RepID=UPI00028A11C5|nr:helix-turn-helix domain-containing protein [Salinibacterium sp. PAMC 21357]
MQTIESTNTADSEVVEETLAALQDSPLAAQLQALVRQLREGPVKYVTGDKPLTPNEAAKFLQISRPVVMSLIRRGELTALRVGERDNRIPFAEIQSFVARRDAASKDLAASFARGASAHDDAILRVAGVDAERAAEFGF